jgi:hypothetical protein
VSKDVKKIKQGDAKFYLNDGMITYPRAAIYVEANCPRNVRETLEWGVAQGYITCVAHVYGKELTMDALRD